MSDLFYLSLKLLTLFSFKHKNELALMMNDMYNDSYFCMEFIIMFISPFHVFRKTALVLALSAFWSGLLWANQPEVVQTMETIEVTASADDVYVATQANSVLKSDKPLFETAQSVSVITNEQLQQKQPDSFNQILQGTSGVNAGYLGRRGFDDFIIRGQIASDNMFVDGLRLSKDMLNSVDPSGLESVQVLKGPSSVGFGLVSPGGLVNVTTKRPTSENFKRATLSYGSYDLKRASFDVNIAPNTSEKGAFRLNGSITDKEDPTDEVYWKNYYIASSYNFNLGEDKNLTLSASYQNREFVRQQGVPAYGSLLANPNANFDSTRFINEPTDINYYDNYLASLNYSQKFAKNWQFKHNFNYFNSSMMGALTAFRGYPTRNRVINYGEIQRRNAIQHRDIESYAMDNQLHKTFKLGKTEHQFTFGVDAMLDQLDLRIAQTGNLKNNLNLTTPIYHLTDATLNSHRYDISKMHYIGVYLRNQMKYDDWILNLALRHDWAKTKLDSTNLLTNVQTISQTNDRAFTGNASLMYSWNDRVAPYISYATSFMPQAGADINGNAFSPETGQQVEVGVKMQTADQRVQGSLAWFDLRKQNIQTTDPTDSNYKVLTGEQQTRGVEMDLVASLTDQWNILANYSYTPDAKTTKSNILADVGKRIAFVPEHTANLSTQYYFDPSKQGWNIGAGLRYVGDSETNSTSQLNLPSYHVYDFNVGYEAPHWGIAFNLKNIFDKQYYTGMVSQTTNDGIVAVGDPRTALISFKLNY